MNLTAQEDIHAPREAVFDVLCTFETYEKAAGSRGAVMQRRDIARPQDKGPIWDVRFQMRGEERALVLDVTDLIAPERICATMSSKPYDGALQIDLIELSPTRTQLQINFAVTANTLKSRLALKTASLARGKLEAEFQKRVDVYIDALRLRLVQAS